MGSSTSAPPPPDYASLIPQQTAANKDQFNYALDQSRINTNGPAGQQNWTQGPDGRWTQNTTLNPLQQQTYNNQQNLSNQFSDTASNLLGGVQQRYGTAANFAGELPQFENQSAGPYSGPNYDSHTRDDVTAGIYGQATQMLDPQFARAEHDQRSDLVAQGFSTDSDAYRRASDQLAQQKQQAYQGARNSAIAGGESAAAQEAQTGLGVAGQRFQANMAGAQFGAQNQAQHEQFAQESVAQQAADRARQLNELNAFRTGSQVAMPTGSMQSQAPQGLQGTDLLGATKATFDGQLAQANAQNAAAGNTQNGLMGLAGAGLQAFAMSDRRLKKDIMPIGTTLGGNKVYDFKYKGSDQPMRGVMAQDLLKTQPGAVGKMPNGFYAVDYSKVK